MHRKIPVSFISLISLLLFLSCPTPVSSPKERVVTLDGNGGSSDIGSIQKQKVIDGESFTLPTCKFTRDGYSFLYWNPSVDNPAESRYNIGDSLIVDYDMTLFAIWGLNRTISFNSNGGDGSMTAVTVGDGGAFTAVSCAFTRDGYSFLYWNTMSDGSGDRYFPGDTVSVSADLTLFAIWGANRTVAFNANSGTGSMTSATVGDGGTYTVPSCAFTRSGYSFSHWNTANDDSGTSYSVGSTLTVTTNVMLYAIWIANHTITFNANSGTGNMTPATVRNGDSFTLPVNSFSRDGYSFLYWNTASNNSGTRKYPGDSVTVTSDLVFYAIWGANRIISFDANEGSGTMDSVVVANGGTFTAIANEFTRVGYSFLHWNTEDDDSGITYSVGQSIPITGDLVLYAIWGANRIVSFDSNSGEGSMTSATVGDGGTYTVPSSAFTRSGYSFSHWNTASNDSGTSYSVGSMMTVTADVTLYAIWIANRTITFDDNGGMGTMANGSVANGGTYTVPSSAFTRSGYSFSHWNTASNDSGTSYSVGSTMTVTADVTLYAIWIANRTITFDDNGGTGTMANGSVANGGTYTVPSCGFTRSGYSFSHWNTASNNSGTSYSVGSTMTVTADMTLYAIWIANRTITFDDNGGTGTMANGSVANGGTYTVPSCGFTRSGYSFSHWNTANDDSGTSYSVGSTMTVTADVTLYAIWIANRTITFNDNGGTGTMASGSVANGGAYTVPSCGFTRSGYSFSHWNTASNNSGTSYSVGSTMTVTADVTLYAIWIANRTITFNANSGTGTMASGSVANGGTYTVPSCGFTRSGYSFSHWNTASNDSGTSYSVGSTMTVTADVTLYAIWIANRTITFNANSGTGTMASGSVANDHTYTVPSCAFTRSGYSFSHWNTASNDSGTSYSVGSTMTVTADVTLYAIWIANRTITFNANSGTGTMASATVADGASFTVPSCTFTRTGYTFSHWNTASDDSGTDYDNGDTIGSVTANISLYAIWQPNTYTIAFNANLGSGSMTSENALYDSSYTVPACTFTRAGYSFLRWNTASNGSGTSYDADDWFIVSGNVTLYAIWEVLPSLIHIDFNDGSTLAELFDTVTDAGNALTIQSARAMSGSALRRNLGSYTDLWLALPTGTNDFWVMYDVYIETSYQFVANTHTPLVLMYGTHTTQNDRFLGVPLYNGYIEPAPIGFTALRPLTNLNPTDAMTFANTPITIENPIGRWINVKYHIKMDGVVNGLAVYIDKSLVMNTIATRDAPESVQFDMLRIDYPSGNDLDANSNIYMDNIGIYAQDPD